MAIRTEYSSLRHGLLGAWCPSLGASGRLLVDRGPLGSHATFAGTAYSWSLDLSVTGTISASTTYRPETDFERTSSFSVAAWVSVTSLAERTIVTNSPNAGITGWEFQVAANGAVRLLIGNLFSTNYLRASSTGSFLLAANTTYHIAATYPGTSSASDVRFFVNGVQYATTADFNTLSASTVTGSPLRFFSRSNSTTPWGGRIDDVRLYNRVLTLAEIRLLASRRGIGLTPLPDRAAGLPRRWSVNVGGDWRPADSYVNVAGVWRLGQPSVNVSGTWK